MKLKLDKVTMSCVAVLSSAILFGINSNVVKADSGSDSSQNAVSTVQPKDDEIRVDGQSWADGFNNITWAVYTINGDRDNLQLRLGVDGSNDAEVAGTTTSAATMDWAPYLDKISSVKVVGKIKTSGSQIELFGGMPNLQTVSGLNLLDTSGTRSFSGMFRGDTSLKNVDLSGLGTPSVTEMSNMFYGDKSLVSLDLSVLDMNSVTDVRNMFLGTTSLVSLTLGPKSVITNSALADDPFTYMKDGKTYTADGWKDESNSTNILPTQKLMSMYSSGNDAREQTTWVPNTLIENVDFKIKYIASDTGEALPVKSDETYSGVKNEDVDLTNYTLSKIGQLQPGYAADSLNDNNLGQIESDGNNGYVVNATVHKLPPVHITVTQTLGNDKPKDVSFDIPKNDTSYKYTDISDPSNGTLDINKSTIKIGTNDAISFKNYFSKTDLNSILSHAIDSQLNSYKVFGDNSSENPITVDAVYTKTSSGGDNGNSGGSNDGNHNNGNHNNNENNNENNQNSSSKDVNQTISTATKLVNIYDEKGKLVTNRILDKDSAWFSDQEYTLDGTQYYRVSTGEYVKASDVYVYTAQDNVVHVQPNSIVYLVDSQGKKITDRALGPSSDWFTDRYTMINGQKYYRVATNEFVSADKISLV
ncbi:SLAP domain-containing protein [Companilactobacillus muriivasis]|uniref:SLAP domain-containing protein n=1 Tax=Companilactobacillus muriivasis TaxID=3081444 RepID=UPI0030C67152